VYTEKENAIVLKNVNKSFSGVKATDDVSFTLGYGKSTVLIGPNGAGKTTLFNLITGEVKMDSGEIYIFGVDVSNSSVQKRREIGLARTYQIVNLFNGMTVEENMYLALNNNEWRPNRNKFSFLIPWQKDRNKMDRIKEILKSVKLEGKKHILVSNLSHGEQRQLELGMAIATDPKIMLLDEPMAGLTPNERKFIRKLILELAGEKNIIVIEHDIDFALSITDNVMVLDHGKIIAKGSPESIKGNVGVQKIYKM